MKSFCIRLILVFCFMPVLLVYASEHNLDSLKLEISNAQSDTLRINLLNELANALSSRNIKACLSLCDSIITLSKEVSYTNGLVDALQTKGFVYAISADLQKSSSTLNQALEYLNESPDESRKASVLYALGIAHVETGDFETAEPYFLESHSIKLRYGSIREMIKSWNGISNLYRSVGNYTKTLEAYHAALNLTSQTDDYELKMLPLIGLGQFYSSKGDFAKALEYQLRGEKYSQRITDLDSRGKVLVAIGGTYLRMKEYESSLSYYEKGFEILKKIGQLNVMGIVLRDMALAHGHLGNQDKVAELLQRALSLYRNSNQDCMVTHVYGSLSKHYRKNDLMDSAYYYANKAVSMANQCNEPYKLLVALKTQARWYKKAGDTKTSIALFTQAYKIAQDQSFMSAISEVSRDLANLYESQGDYFSALKYHRTFQKTKDSLFNKENTQKITRLESQFEFEKEKEVMVAEQEKQEYILQQEIEKQRIVKFSVTAGAVLLLILAINFYMSFKAKKKDHQLLSQQNTKIITQASELQTTNDQLIELSNFKEGLTHMIAHDMKNPLNVIIGLSEANKKDRQLHDINQSGKQMLNMVTNMLDIQRFEEAEIHLDPDEIKLIDLVRAGTHQVELLAHAKGINISVDVQNDVTVECNEEMMVRVLVNLLSNSIKYSSFDSEIKVIGTFDPSQSGFVTLSIQDEGEGISAEELPHIFEKFWQVRAQDSGTTKSTGLGLTYCKMAIEAHGGTINVKSEVTAGTTFSFEIPLTTIAVEGTDHQTTENTIKNKKPVILDEEKIQLKSYAEHLKKLKVYQASEINNIIEQMDKQELQSTWKEELKIAVYECNKEKFTTLVNMI